MKFLAGVGIGFGVGLLIAPARGQETRRKLKEKAEQVAEAPRKKAVETLEASKGKAGAMGEKIGRQVAEAAVDTLKERLANTSSEEQTA